MRWTLLFLLVYSLNAYSENIEPHPLPCGGQGCWDSYLYVVWPFISTTLIPILISIDPADGTDESVQNVSKSTHHSKNKLIINSKTHAASYVASNGEINSAYLEQALAILRKEYPDTSDMELAQAILAY